MFATLGVFPHPAWRPLGKGDQGKAENPLIPLEFRGHMTYGAKATSGLQASERA